MARLEPILSTPNRERLRRQLRVFWGRSHAIERGYMFLLGVLVGGLAGLGAIALRAGIGGVHWVFFDWLAPALSSLGPLQVVLLPALGGLLVGPLVYLLAREARGHGVPEIMEALAVGQARIRPRVALVKTLASALCIGSGGSTGREGPIAQIGAAAASSLGQWLRLREDQLRTVVAAGAAGGIAATFNAPLGGTFFALEIILADWTAERVTPVLAAAVVAGAVGRAAFGDIPAFPVAQYGLAAWGDLALVVLLGLLAAPVGLAFLKALYSTEAFFEGLPTRVPWLLPAAGGLLVGFLGLYHQELLGVGYGLIGQVLAGAHPDVVFLLVVLGLKILATSLTLGSGGSGGIFAPSLFMGAMLGSAFGSLMHGWFPGLGSTPGAFALVGMAAVFAAVAHAPGTAMLTVFELTGDYRTILPLMIACGVSVSVARGLFRFSIYNLRLHLRDVHFELARDPRVLSEIRVAEAMIPEVITVRPEFSVAEAEALFERTSHHGFPVVDAQGHLRGMLTMHDLRQAGADRPGLTVHDLAAHDLVICTPQESLNDALTKMGLLGVGRLPVVDEGDHRVLLGLITRKSLIDAYRRALSHRHTHLHDTIKRERFG